MKSATRVYVASRLENVENVKRVNRQLASIGCELTYDWTVHGSVQAQGVERMSQVATLESKGVERAGTLIVLLPGGRGTHVELGIAAALGTITIIHSEDDTPFLCNGKGSPCAFYFTRYVTRVVAPFEWFITNLEHVIDRAGDFNTPADIRITLSGNTPIVHNIHT